MMGDIYIIAENYRFVNEIQLYQAGPPRFERESMGIFTMGFEAH